MKKTVLLYFCLQSLLIFGQGFDMEWAKTFQSPTMTKCLGITTSTNGTVYTTGNFEGTVDFDPGVGVHNRTSYGDENIFVSKLDSNGNFLWVKQMGAQGYGLSVGTSIATDHLGNVLVTGYFSFTVDFDPGDGVVNLTANGIYDCFVLKLDANGNFLWVRSLNGGGSEYGHAIKADPSGNVIVAGEFKGTADLDPNEPVVSQTSNGSVDAFVFKLDANGNTLWTKSFGGTGLDAMECMAVDHLGNTYVGGSFSSTIDFDTGVGVYNVDVASSTGYILKLQANGEFEWVRKTTTSTVNSNRSYVTSLAVDAQGNVHASGHFVGTINLDPFNTAHDFSVFTAPNTDVYVGKWTGDGNFIWGKHFGGTARMENSGIAVDRSGNVISSGHFHGTIDFDPSNAVFNIPTAGEFDVYIAKLNVNGNFIDAVNIGGPTADLNNGVAISATDRVHITGYYFGATDFDPNAGSYVIPTAGTSITTGDGYVAKYSFSKCVVTGIDQKSACGSFTWINGTTYTASNNTATHTIVNGGVGGCDSIVTLNLTINQATSSNVNVSACESYTWALNNQTYASSGVYTHVIPNTANCDSTITLNLTITESTSSSVSASACESYTWPLNNQTYASSGVYTHVIPNAANCDSTVTLNLTINQGTSSSVSASACESYTWSLNNQTYATSGVYTHVIPNAANCDSTITLNLTITESTSSSVSASACESYTWPLNNQTYATSGVYTHVIPNAANCDSTVTLNLTITESTSSNVNASACESYTWALNNHTYASSGVYTHVIPNAANCDSTITLNLTINQATSSSVTVATCESYTWPLNNQTYATSGVYTHVIPNAANCDSTVTLNLTINESTSSTVSASACESYTWALNNQTYATSGVYTHVIPNAANCDSTITLNLTISESTSSNVSASACESYTWALNNQTYVSSGVYTHVIPNAANCDSTVTLNLTISESTSSNVSASACESYTWSLNNQTYVSSGVYTHVIPNAANCDSTITLNLTITESTSSSVSASACESYTWPLNNQTYASSGVYTHVIPNAANCDSTITLNLTINQGTSSNVSASACESYTWPLNNQTYASSGVYTHVIPNAANCDSTITLNLTINALDASVSVNGISLSANQTGATYQWINCLDNSPIVGETNAVFTASENGDYAVEISTNDCSVTSACVTVNSVGIDEVSAISVSIHPNPTNGAFSLTSSHQLQGAHIEIYSPLGQLVFKTIHSEKDLKINLSEHPNGVYLIKVNQFTSRVVIAR